MTDFNKYHSCVEQIVTLLKKNNCWFETFEHEPVKTSQEAAEVRTGYTLKQGAKALILKVDYKSGESGFIQAVIPGHLKLNSKKLTKLLGAKSIRFAKAEEISQLTNRVQIGGIPPFGNLFGIEVVVDESMQEFEKIIFNAGDRSFSIGMKLKNYLEIVRPNLASFAKS